MNSVTISASREYTIHIGSGLIDQIGTYARQIVSPCKVAIISDSNVWPLYGDAVRNSLSASDFQTVNFVFSAGEESKNASTYIRILNFLAENRLTRSDLIIALGGGVTGDITGFAAATYLRGIRYIQSPTSLLAMVDSSVGGKTAIDLPAGKNLVGAFYQPSAVLCDIDTLSTLPQDVFIDGCAEVIKYGVLYDPCLFSHLEQNGLSFDREYVITRCVELKKAVVMEDEFDTGNRQMLNLGHTIGHAIEALSEYQISHGKAVAIGMSIVAAASAKQKTCTQHTAQSVLSLLELFGLPTKTSYSAEQLNNCALSDKKRAGSTIALIIPEEVGKCRIHSTPISQLQSFIEAGLT